MPTVASAPPRAGARVDLSVVLINWRMGRDLALLMPSLGGHPTEHAVEVIVVNKASGDGTEALATENPWIRLIPHDVFGIAEMRNVGIRAARGRYVLMLDADTEVLPGCFDALVQFMDAHPKVATCGGHTRRIDGELEPNVKRFYSLGALLMRRTLLGRLWPDDPWNRRHLNRDRDWTKSFLSDWVAGACFCMRREALEQVGLFDDGYLFGFEDVDWCWRAKRAGWQVAYCPDAKIIHKVQRQSARGFNRLYVEHVRSGLRFFRRRWLAQLGLALAVPRLESDDVHQSGMGEMTPRPKIAEPRP